eukprot:sb/3473691/
MLLDAAIEHSEALLRDMLLAENNYSDTALHSAENKGDDNLVKLLLTTANQADALLLEEILLKKNKGENTPFTSPERQQELIRALPDRTGKLPVDEISTNKMAETSTEVSIDNCAGKHKGCRHPNPRKQRQKRSYTARPKKKLRVRWP